jgi:hypothetical protein
MKGTKYGEAELKSGGEMVSELTRTILSRRLSTSRGIEKGVDFFPLFLTEAQGSAFQFPISKLFYGNKTTATTI